ncbi:uncharacterized protein SCHCODRAFT_01043577, partial [Schizophyllum commune H4-8]|uniref:uncharacterized protein n=1 Tax=Schizophyllum commune (strain H4-8 / FGSC 9210) TaxID=578458 RepID=UPI00215E736B
MPWLRKHNPQIDWTSLTIQFGETLRAVTFEPETRTQYRSVVIKVLPRDEDDWVGEAPDDPNTILEDVVGPQPQEETRDLAWDEPGGPRQLNSKQRKR